MATTLRVLNKLLAVIVIVNISALVLLVFANVILRYIFHSGIPWTVEVSSLLFVWLIFLGAVLALREQEHLGVDLFVVKLPLWAQKAMFVLINAIIVAVMVIFIQGLLVMMKINGSMTGSATPIPVNVLYLAGLVAAVLMILICIAQVIEFVFLGRGGPTWSRTNAGQERHVAEV